MVKEEMNLNFSLELWRLLQTFRNEMSKSPYSAMITAALSGLYPFPASVPPLEVVTEVPKSKTVFGNLWFRA